MRAQGREDEWRRDPPQGGCLHGAMTTSSGGIGVEGGWLHGAMTTSSGGIVVEGGCGHRAVRTSGGGIRVEVGYGHGAMTASSGGIPLVRNGFISEVGEQAPRSPPSGPAWAGLARTPRRAQAP